MNNDPLSGGSFQAPPAPATTPVTTPITPMPPATESSGWAPTAEPAASVPISTPISTSPPPVSPASPAVGSNPFEATPPPVPPVSGPMQSMGGEPGMEPAGPKSSLPLILILIVLLILGGVFLASWMNWIPLFGLEKLWGGGKPTPAIEEPTPAPATNVNDAKRKDDLANLKTALKQYYTVTQSYPMAATVEKTSAPVALAVLVPEYLTALPVDPLSPAKYYGYKSDGKTFTLTAVLEDTTDPAGIMDGEIFLYKITDGSAETTTPDATSNPTQ